jgi:hypothetical protein
MDGRASNGGSLCNFALQLLLLLGWIERVGDSHVGDHFGERMMEWK